MPRNSFRHIAAVLLLAAAVAAPALAEPLAAGRTRIPARHHTTGTTPGTSLWTFFVHLIGASGGTFDPNGGR
jgi:membrane protein DedA with SNARE-associated domain